MYRRSNSRFDCSRVCWYLFLVVAAAVLFARFLHPADMLGFYQDDFFYYLKVVQNFAVHGVSTFDGIHLTNGYHPLWMLTLLALYKLMPAKAFFYALQALTLACVLIFYRRTAVILARFSDDRTLCSLATLLVSLLALLLLRYGMEITLTLPLAVWLLDLTLQEGNKKTPIGALLMGAVAALTVLSRLDSILLVALVLAVVWLPNRDRSSTRWVTFFLLGFAPLLLIYFAVNHHVFHTFMPVSGQAKQMKSGLWPSLRGPESLLWPLDRMKLVFVPACLLLWCIGVSCLRRASLAIPRWNFSVMCALLAFPFVHLLALSMLSDWVLWPWYLYPFVLSALATFALLAVVLRVDWNATERPSPARLPLLAVTAVFCALDFGYLAAYCVLMPSSIKVFQSSAQLAVYIDLHPGVYAMGDQAGTTAYLTSQPIIQLEGLTMDVDHLHKIREREPLGQALREYGAQYYVTFPGPMIDGCIEVREPAQAGPTSPAMAGKICQPPLATFDRDTQKISVFPADAVQ